MENILKEINEKDRLDEITKELREFATFNIAKIMRVNSISASVAFNKILAEAKNGDTIYFPAGTYEIDEDLDEINKIIKIKGAGARLTTLKAMDNVKIIRYCGSKSYTFDGYLMFGCSIEGLTIEGNDKTNAGIYWERVGRVHMTDVIIQHVKDIGLNFKYAQDFAINNIYVRYCGDKTKDIPAVKMCDIDTSEANVNTKMNVNDIKFVNCTFEHNEGQLLYIDGLYTNSIVFQNCKFEYGGEKGDPVAIKVNKGSRISFDNCRFTNAQYSGMFEFIETKVVNIRGFAYNNQYDIENTKDYVFAKFTDCKVVKVEISGIYCGVCEFLGKTIISKYNISDQTAFGDYYMNNYLFEDFHPYIPVDLRRIIYPRDGAYIDNNGSIAQEVAKKPLIRALLSREKPCCTNVNFVLEVENTSASERKLLVYNEYKNSDKEGNENPNGNIRVASGSSWVTYTLPVEKLHDGYNRFVLQADEGNGLLKIKKFYYYFS